MKLLGAAAAGQLLTNSFNVHSTYLFIYGRERVVAITNSIKNV